jgi:hypothetical protein
VRDAQHDSDGTSVAVAAMLLGISEGAVRKRVERGKLDAETGPDGRLIVYLDSDTTDTTHDTTTKRPRLSRDRYTRSLEDQVEYLRRQLAQEQTASAELRQIVAGLSQANAEQARTIRAIEAPADAPESPEDAQMVEEEPEEEPRSDASGPQTAADDATVDGPESESPASLEDEYNEEQERSRKHKETFARLLGETREEAKATRRRPWWRRVLGR